MKGAHLTLDDRKIIQRDLENGMNRAQIAKELGKSPSTISKEIKLHKNLSLPAHTVAESDISAKTAESSKSVMAAK